MKRNLKCLISLLLVLMLIISAMPATAQAAIAINDKDTATVQAGEVSVEGKDSVGTLLASTFAEEVEKEVQTVSGDNCIKNLKVNGTTAIVAYQASTKADMVVAVYDETSGQMLGSGTSDIDVNKKSVSISIKTDKEMPAYFIAIAYLLDIESHEPVCDKFVTEMYTKKMQNFMDTTIQDYDEELVLNLDNKNDTNFGVYNDDTLQVNASSQSNILNDKGNGIYIITNADKTFTDLKKGDTFSYNYADGTVVLVKIASISVYEDTVTVTSESNVDLRDFFDYMKIEANTNEKESVIKVDNSELEEGVTYQPQMNAQTLEADAEASRSYSLSYALNKKIGNSVTLKGGMTYSFNASVQYCLVHSYQYISFKIDFSEKLDIATSGSVPLKEIPLGRIEIPMLPCVYLGFTPSFLMEASAKLSWSGELKGTIGSAYDSDTGHEDLNESPKTSSKVEFEGKLFVGVKATPYVSIISSDLCKKTLNTRAGVEISAKQNIWKDTDDSDKNHNCTKCYKGEINTKLSATVSIDLIKNVVKKDIKLREISKKIADFYYSVDCDEFAYGNCPHISYRVQVTVCDSSGRPAKGLEIQGTKLDKAPVTGDKGVAVFYLPNGYYQLSVAGKGNSVSKDITVKDRKKEISMTLEESTSGDNSENKDDTDTGGNSAASKTEGVCGENLTWKLYDKNKLKITGTGDMTDFDYGKAPWVSYCDDIISVEIGDGVTSVGNSAFLSCHNLTEVVIPKGVISIGYSAFSDCISLKEIVLPQGVTSIGAEAFERCSSLKEIAIPEGITVISYAVFRDCGSLTTVTLPKGVAKIDEDAFSDCSSLKDIYIMGDKPIFVDRCFDNVTSNLYFPFGNDTWKEGPDGFGYTTYGDLTRIPYDYNTNTVVPFAADNAEENDGEVSNGNQEISLNMQDMDKERLMPLKFYVGNYTMENAAQKASFTGLAPNKAYVFLVVRNTKAAELLSADNLLYIMQDESDSNGNLTFHYIARTNEKAEAGVYGAANKKTDLKDAKITVEPMTYSGRRQEVKVSVAYNNVMLTRDKDYMISGNLFVTDPGTYSITITGQNEYTGAVTKSFKVSGKKSDGLAGQAKVSQIKISAVSKKIAAGKKVKLKVAVTPKNASDKTMTWKSSNTKVATVNKNGVVTMKKNSGGKKVIISAMATDGSGAKASYKITSMKGVVKKIAVSGNKSVKAGDCVKLKAKVTATKQANTKVKWKSSNTKYAKVNGSGRVITYKRGKGKKVKITAMAIDGSGKKKTVTIKLK